MNEQKKVFDYIGAYEKAIRDVIAACGSRQAANVMLDDLHKHYEITYSKLQELDTMMNDDHPLYPVRKRAILAKANNEVHEIIEKHAPHTSDHIRELIIGASLAVTAVTLPITSTLAPLVVATGIVAIGSSYYIGFKILRNWRAISGKHKVAHFAGQVGPKHVKGLIMTKRTSIAKGKRISMPNIKRKK